MHLGSKPLKNILTSKNMNNESLYYFSKATNDAIKARKGKRGIREMTRGLASPPVPAAGLPSATRASASHRPGRWSFSHNLLCPPLETDLSRISAFSCVCIFQHKTIFQILLSIVMKTRDFLPPHTVKIDSIFLETAPVPLL